MPNLDEIHTLIAGSSPADWNPIEGPTFLGQTIWERDGAGQPVPDQHTHMWRAVYKPDVSIGLAWGLVVNDDFEEPWANKFADRRASCHYLDVLHHGAVVDRHVRVHVDHSLCGLPLPEMEHIDDRATITNYWITTWQHRFFAVVNSLEMKSDFDRYVHQAGFEVREDRR